MKTHAEENDKEEIQKMAKDIIKKNKDIFDRLAEI